MNLEEEFQRIVEDQKDFNVNFFKDTSLYAPSDTSEYVVSHRSKVAKELILHLIKEATEVLDAVEWKPHRRLNTLPNPFKVKEELTDVFKLFLSMWLSQGLTIEDLVKSYWSKSMVCRQRYSEEFLNRISENNPSHKYAVVDIDGVIADYSEGLLTWMEESGNYVHLLSNIREYREFQYKWLDFESLGVPKSTWEDIKHAFRISGGKRNLPVYPYSNEMLEYLRNLGYKLVILTSRPIDAYSTIYMDTLEWLRTNNLPFDYVWWTHDKSNLLMSKGLKESIVYVIEDDIKFIKTYLDSGIGRKIFHVARSGVSFNGAISNRYVKVDSLLEVISNVEKEELKELKGGSL